MFIKIFLRDDKVKDWIKSENIKTSSILMILKKNLGYKNRGQILRNINYCLSATFLNTKLCWRTDAEYSDICCTLNGLIRYCSSLNKHQYYFGKSLLDYVENRGVLKFIPYYRTLDGDEESPLIYWTLEKSMERWIKEKF